MVMKGQDGTLYSCLTGKAFQGPRFGHRLEPRTTLVTDWGFWHKRYPQALAFAMFDKYRPAELPTAVNEDSRKCRGPADGRLPADTMVLGVWDGQHARAYPLDVLEKAGVLYDTVKDKARVVFWYGPTRTAAAYQPAVFVRGRSGGYIGEGSFKVDPKGGAAPFVDRRTGGHWDITGRGVGGGPMLAWLDSVQVKWFAWAAEYPETSIYGKEAARPDHKPLTPKSRDAAGPLGNLDVKSRRFGILKATDPQRRRITLVLDGETEPKEWPLRPGAEVWHAGWWGRLDQLTAGDRVWVWFETDRGKGGPLAVALLADELSEQDLYAPVKVKAVNAPGTLTLETAQGGKPAARTVELAKAEVFRGDARAPRDSLKAGERVYVQTTGEGARLILDPAAFEKRRSAQKAALRKRWAEEGLPGTLIFSHPRRREVELMLDHEAMRWGRSLGPGDKVTLLAPRPVPAVVRQLRPWRERTQLLLQVEGSDEGLTVGRRVALKRAAPPADAEDRLPAGLDRGRARAERIEWLAASVYCPCKMHDGCAGHFFTLAACNSGPDNPCGTAKRIREDVAGMIDKGRTDRQVFERLLEVYGAKLLRPHMLP
jgi:hypothetical protein